MKHSMTWKVLSLFVAATFLFAACAPAATEAPAEPGNLLHRKPLLKARRD